ncbi:unnamed protein product [Toxocara canis]|uniref:EGF-like domain-containing protein n=1 Tax=Toxocara canis TaxID=6265 RepID=A0A3P7I2T0_TOXCA|nr:unnamed protein product [Toxocara canis]
MKIAKKLINFRCVECEKGWSGEQCEQIECKRGESDQEKQKCICPKPYSGQHCESLTTADVYSYYNHMAFSLGPLGVITIIPMLIALYGCEYMARKRKIRRVESMLGDQHINVNRRVVSDLLEPKTV